VPQLEAWQKVYVDEEKFIKSDPHAKATCIQCHGGVAGTDNMDEAHKGIVVDPTIDPEIVTRQCGTCHAEITKAQLTSLHFDSHGYDKIMQARLNPAMAAAWEKAETNHCSSCHTSCGQCHVSQPTSVGGGLISGHQFKKVQAFTRTCTGCHGSRINNEYTGRNEGIPADVHWTKAGMACFKCHTGQQLHGMEGPKSMRYDGPPSPACTQCHPNALAGKGQVMQHNLHGDKLQCQVCHSVDYKNCYSCHVQTNDKGSPYFKIEPSVNDFKIGLNPLKSPDRPWDYVVVRHAPIDPKSFEFYGQNVLSNFDALPTWKFATPHNIQRVTPQSEACDNCHGKADLFLSEKDLQPYEIEANQKVIAPVPAPR
jgi:hypothetical protein